MINKNIKIIEDDKKYIWHPCTQMKDHQNFSIIPIKQGNGIYLLDFNGNLYIDAISSWWVNLFGHNNKFINKAILKQIHKVEHIIFAGFTHEPAVKLAKELVRITPERLNKIFFADNGSSAVEVALKMSFHFHKNRGDQRDIFLSLNNSYHGETIGALSIGDVSLYKEIYSPLLFKSIQTTVPKNQTIESALVAIEELEILLSLQGDKISAFIIEPLVQGAGGMHMYHPIYITKARELCNNYKIHLIADEILTGFGRTGTMFAMEQTNVSPDFMTLSKGLTGGYLPLAVVMTTDDIYNSFYEDYNNNKSFLHSHSYTGNPIACSAANATLDIFKQSHILKQNLTIRDSFEEKLEEFKKFKSVKEVRFLGMIFVIELKGYNPKDRVGVLIHRFALEEGVLIRPLGNVIYIMPPYIIKEFEIKIILDVIHEAILYIEDKFKYE